MQSITDIDQLIALKKREIELEKTHLGLSPPRREHTSIENKENGHNSVKSKKQVKYCDNRVLQECNESTRNKKENSFEVTTKELDDFIPADLERYIRRHIGLPGMLKAGEYSPNNPLMREDRAPGDAFPGFGEYERRRNTLRKIQQKQYREYLDQQAKRKQEAKQLLERERLEREQRERDREERQRELAEERDRFSPDRRRNLQHLQSSQSVQRDQYGQYQSSSSQSNVVSRVDTGVQVDGFSQPLSVAVQTDDMELCPATTACPLSRLTQAERELSPRNASQYAPQVPRRRSYGDFYESSCLLKRYNRERLTSEPRQSHVPSIFDADVIRLRNLQAEKEAAERRQYYQQELKNQIIEHQRIREERKNREKMLEHAEMRRLEEQLRMLRVAQERERGRQDDIAAEMKESTTEYNKKRSELQKEIDFEQENLLRANTQTISKQQDSPHNKTITSKLPFYYPKIYERSNEINKKPYSTNIPENSIFSSDYDVDSYLRKNLNFNKNSKHFHNVDILDRYKNSENDRLPTLKIDESSDIEINIKDKKVTTDCPDDIKTKHPSIDTLPIPVLRYLPKNKLINNQNDNMSDSMKRVDDKYKVPAVQKNILKALPNENGKSGNILTQLGSIRRQLQLEQLKLDNMLPKGDEM